MKTPTLIVRLIGLYLVAACGIGLIQIEHVHSVAGPIGIGTQQQTVISNLQTYAIIGLIVGIAATAFAGPFARLLTFDSEPKTENADIADQLLKRKMGTPNPPLPIRLSITPTADAMDAPADLLAGL